MNSTAIIFLILVVLGVGAYASSKIKKTDNGFEVTEVKTYYENRIIWGDSSKPLHNTEVVAYGDGWEYSTTTDDDGIFTVEVKPNSPFTIKASDGNIWAVFDGIIDGIEEGTTKVETSQ